MSRDPNTGRSNVDDAAVGDRVGDADMGADTGVGGGAVVARRRRVLGVLGALTAVAPLGTDMYVPALVEVSTDLDAPPWAVQLSLTGFLVGIVAGQLLLGPLSDRLGRRPVLLAGAAGFAVSSAVAGLAADIVWFDLARLIQGLCGAAGLVVARAIITDVFDDDESAPKFATLAAITAAAPITAPLLGGAVTSVASWRAVFLVLTLIGLLLALGVAAWIPETRNVGHYTGLRGAYTDMASLAGHRPFVGLVLALSFGNAAIFAYIAGAPFVFAQAFGFSPAMISLVFGTNAAGNLCGALIYGRLSHRIPTSRAAWPALLAAAAATTALVVLTAISTPAPVLWVGLFVAVTAFGVLFPALTTQAQNTGRSAPGGASALLGAGQFLTGALVSPVVGAFDTARGVPLSAVMAACFLLAAGGYLITRHSSAAGPS